MVNPRRLYAVLAGAEAVTWALLLLGMALKYLTRTTELGVAIAGPIHGFVFLAFVAGTVLVGVDQRWGKRDIALGLVSAVPPFATVWFERRMARSGLLDQPWRLPLVHRAGRRPLLTGSVVLLGLAVAFLLALQVGPPTA